MSRKTRAKQRRQARQRSQARRSSRQLRMTFAVEVASGDELPTEFRIFVAGWNDSENGRVLFDDAAAAATMAAWEKHGVDRMIDLEHLSLDQESISFDPDARGWTKLELRNGELWAVDVRWTDDGADRLRTKRQRFISPTFFFDAESKRVTKILNIALTALPATHDIAPLVAARASTGDEMDSIQSNNLSGEQAAAALEAVKNQDGDAALAIVEAMLAAGMMPEGEEPAPEPVEGEELADEEHPEEAADDPEMHNSETTAEVAAATARLLRLTDRKTLGEALDEVDVMRASHVQLEAKESKLAKERATLELSERKRIAKRHIDIGVANPATTGLNGLAKDADGKAVPLAWRYLNTPISELRAELKQLEAQHTGSGAQSQSNATAPLATNKFGLTDSELKACKAEGCDPEIFAALKARGKAS